MEVPHKAQPKPTEPKSLLSQILVMPFPSQQMQWLYCCDLVFRACFWKQGVWHGIELGSVVGEAIRDLYYPMVFSPNSFQITIYKQPHILSDTAYLFLIQCHKILQAYCIMCVQKGLNHSIH